MNTVSLSERLSSSPAVDAARTALGDGAGVWLVGGSIRDAALGRDVVDVDLAVGEGEADAARAISAVVEGHAFELSGEYGTWRIVVPGEDWHIDVTRLRAGEIEGDLRLRDFTVNAMALPLDALDTEPLDPSGGLADVESGILRTASPGAFEDDPLRVLRCARLVAELRFEVDSETRELARKSAARAGEPAGERQLAELSLLFGANDLIRGLEVLDEVGGTAALLPEVHVLRGVEQNPNHHLDVHGHTIEVLRHLLELEGDLGHVAGDRAGDLGELLDEDLADGFSRRDALRFGALLHDVGKPGTRDDSRGYVTFIGHDHTGAQIVDAVCARLKTSRALRAYLRGVTLHHLRLGFLATEQPLEPRRIHDYLLATAPVSADVTLLTVADRLAARGEGPLASPEVIDSHLALAREMLAAALDRHRDGPPRSPIPGDELAERLGIEPGPELGGLIAEVEAGVFAGEVEGPESAVELARAALERGRQ